MGTAQVTFEVVLWGGATGSDMTGSDVSHMTRSDVSHVPCPEVYYAHAQPEVAQYPTWCSVLTGSDKVTWPEDALSGSGHDGK
jgi:hypothetical protein